MTNLDTIVAVYSEKPGPEIDRPALEAAETDWTALEAGANAGEFKIADAALVENRNGEALVLHRQSHHGWGQGAVVGAVVGILFPPSIVGAAVVGAGGGALVARMRRALDSGKVKDLGETLRLGARAIIVVSPYQSSNAICNTLKGANTTTIVPSTTVEEVQEAMRSGQ
jgi:uncharacterized membrane protein